MRNDPTIVKRIKAFSFEAQLEVQRAEGDSYVFVFGYTSAEGMRTEISITGLDLVRIIESACWEKPVPVGILWEQMKVETEVNA